MVKSRSMPMIVPMSRLKQILIYGALASLISTIVFGSMASINMNSSQTNADNPLDTTKGNLNHTISFLTFLFKYFSI